MRKKLAIIGTGSAGILSICHMLTYLNDYDIYSINDPKIPPLGIGESTNPVFFSTMWNCLGVTLEDLFSNGYLDASIKYGTLYKNWREEDFLNPLFGEKMHQAIHFNTHKIKDFAFNILREKYRGKFFEIQGTVDSLKNLENSVQVLIDGKTNIFEFVIDCRGFPKDNFDDYEFLDMPVNHGLIHNIEGDFSYNTWGYTLHQATEDGWMFGVPLRTRISYGYLFNDNFTNVDEAKSNFSKVIGVKEDGLQKIEYKFKSHYVKNFINKRIIKNGNCSVFFEPMFANSLWLYDYNNRLSYSYIVEEMNSEELNYLFYKKVKTVHDLICYYYKGGSNFNSKFWNYAKTYSECSLKSSMFVELTNDVFKFMNKTSSKVRNVYEFSPYSIDNLAKLDNFLGYNNWQLPTSTE